MSEVAIPEPITIEPPDITNIETEDDENDEGWEEFVVEPPDISHIETEDDRPVDNYFSEKQQRLLTEVLYSSGSLVYGERLFIVAANVGIFRAIGIPPIVPDVFLSLDVKVNPNWQEKQNRTYFMWEHGKPPEVVIEVVSNQKGKELGKKLQVYARMGVWYYIVYDPLKALGDKLLRIYHLVVGNYEEKEGFWLEKVGIGLKLWEGEFEGYQDVWLRWCDEEGNVIPTGAERASVAESELIQERQKAEEAQRQTEEAQQRAERLAAQLRALGIEPEG